MSSIGVRLCEERDRLGNKTQAEFAEIAGVKRNAQSDYERGIRSPDIVYLANIAAIGADIMYIVTGQRSSPLDFPDEELLLLATYKKMARDDKAALIRIMSLIAGHGQ